MAHEIVGVILEKISAIYTRAYDSGDRVARMKTVDG